MQKLSSSIDNFDLFSQEQDDITATIFADTHQVVFDSDGRVTLPETLIMHANIQDKVAFVGRGATFQLWQPETFEHYQKEARIRLQKHGVTIAMKGDQG